MINNRVGIGGFGSLLSAEDRDIALRIRRGSVEFFAEKGVSYDYHVDFDPPFDDVPRTMLLTPSATDPSVFASVVEMQPNYAIIRVTGPAKDIGVVNMSVGMPAAYGADQSAQGMVYWLAME